MILYNSKQYLYEGGGGAEPPESPGGLDDHPEEDEVDEPDDDCPAGQQCHQDCRQYGQAVHPSQAVIIMEVIRVVFYCLQRNI